MIHRAFIDVRPAAGGRRWRPHVAGGWRAWFRPGSGLGSLGASFSTVPSSQVSQLISSAAQQYGVPLQLALQVATQESGLNQTAISPAGAIGVMQLEPGTAGDLGVNPYDTSENIDGGVHYLSQLLTRYGGDQAQALAAYNAGPGRVDNAISSSGGGDWLANLPTETQNYVSSILSAIDSAINSVSPTPTLVSIGSAAVPISGTADTANVDPMTTILLLIFGATLAYFVGDFLLGE